MSTPITRLPIFMLTAILCWGIAEWYGIASPQPGDTFSEIWWFLRDERVGRFAIWMLYTWASFHLMLQRPGDSTHKAPHGWRDIVSLAAGLIPATLETLWPKIR